MTPAAGSSQTCCLRGASERSGSNGGCGLKAVGSMGRQPCPPVTPLPPSCHQVTTCSLSSAPPLPLICLALLAGSCACWCSGLDLGRLLPRGLSHLRLTTRCCSGRWGAAGAIATGSAQAPTPARHQDQHRRQLGRAAHRADKDVAAKSEGELWVLRQFVQVCLQASRVPGLPDETALPHWPLL